MIQGIQYFLQSFLWLGHPSIKKYVIYSFLVSILLFILLAWGVIQFSGWFSVLLSNRIPWDWVGESVLYQWILRILTFILLLGIYKYIVLIVLGPFMSLLSENLEHVLSPDKIGRKVPGITAGFVRGVIVNGVNLCKELFYTLLLVILSFIPGLAIITTPLIFLLQSYFAGYGVMDFYLERYFGFKMSNRVVRSKKTFAVTTGAIFVLIFSIPLVGVILAPVLCTISSTLFFEKEKVPEEYF